ncbi:MAG: hypothetical protein ACR2RB_13385 [Gammaproteobacteria bacterium]
MITLLIVPAGAQQPPPVSTEKLAATLRATACSYNKNLTLAVSRALDVLILAERLTNLEKDTEANELLDHVRLLAAVFPEPLRSAFCNSGSALTFSDAKAVLDAHLRDLEQQHPLVCSNTPPQCDGL